MLFNVRIAPHSSAGLEHHTFNVGVLGSSPSGVTNVSLLKHLLLLTLLQEDTQQIFLQS